MFRTIFFFLLGEGLWGQTPPYDVFPDAGPPYYRLRYEANPDPGKLQFPVNTQFGFPKGRSDWKVLSSISTGVGRVHANRVSPELGTCTGKRSPKNTNALSSHPRTNNPKKPIVSYGAIRATARVKPFFSRSRIWGRSVHTQSLAKCHGHYGAIAEAVIGRGA